ncbi:MAG: hypothetical protein OEU54_05530 [Gemmatimonadota bacterium]|nr:hypothetical protein [Gemmatimonadota bacterium]
MKTTTKAALYGSAGVLAGAAGAAAYKKTVRPRLLSWGATDHELDRVWPSDRLLPDDVAFEATRAITVHAPAETVWRWVVQIGQDRAGFYSYDWIENLFGLDVDNVLEVVPEFQDRDEGDVVWMASPDRFGGKARVIVGLLEPERTMALIGPEDADAVARGEEAEHGFWAFQVEPIDDEMCRLVMRTRSARNPGLGERAAQLLFWELADFIMERKMMKTIKTLAEEEELALAEKA